VAKRTQNVTASYLLLCFGVVFILFLTSLNLLRFNENKKVLGISTNLKNKEKEIRFWENIVVNHPSYRDGWINLAKIELFYGNRDYAIAWFENAQKIDPNSASVAELKNLLGL